MFARVSDAPQPEEGDKRSLLARLFSSPRIEKTDDSLKTRTANRILQVGTDTLVLGLIIGSVTLIGFILDGLLGHDAKFFDSIPVRWIIDTGHLAAFLKYIYDVILDLRR